jgi:hypothetical protein
LQLESLLSSAAESYLRVTPSYDAVFDGLSPTNLYKYLSSSILRQLIADGRTLSELNSNTLPTVILVSAQSTTPQEDWDSHKIDGPADLSYFINMYGRPFCALCARSVWPKILARPAGSTPILMTTM